MTHAVRTRSHTHAPPMNVAQNLHAPVVLFVEGSNVTEKGVIVAMAELYFTPTHESLPGGSPHICSCAGQVFKVVGWPYVAEICTGVLCSRAQHGREARLQNARR